MNMVYWNLALFLMAGGQPVVQVLQGRSCHYNNPGNSCNCDCPPGNRLVTKLQLKTKAEAKQNKHRKEKQSKWPASLRLADRYRKVRTVETGWQVTVWPERRPWQGTAPYTVTLFVSTSGFIVSSISTAQCLNWGQNAAYCGVMSFSALSCDHAVIYCTAVWN